MTPSLPTADARAVEQVLTDWVSGGKVKRIWARDASVWTNTDEAKWLGWLSIVDEQLAQQKLFADFANEVKAGGFTHALLLGMADRAFARKCCVCLSDA